LESQLSEQKPSEQRSWRAKPLSVPDEPEAGILGKPRKWKLPVACPQDARLLAGKLQNVKRVLGKPLAARPLAGKSWDAKLLAAKPLAGKSWGAKLLAAKPLAGKSWDAKRVFVKPLAVLALGEPEAGKSVLAPGRR